LSRPAEQSPEAIRTGKLLLWAGALTEQAFELSPVWCEYREPWELKFMTALGASEEWLKANLFDATEGTNQDFWYASSEGSVFDGQSIAEVASTFTFGQTGQLRGRLTIVDGAITSATLFHCSLLFSRSDVMADESLVSLKLIAKKSGKRPWRDLLPVRYRADVDVSPVPREALLDVALPEKA
jgi:hypothetical protein